jgi:hypothetical protein
MPGCEVVVSTRMGGHVAMIFVTTLKEEWLCARIIVVQPPLPHRPPPER